MRVRAVTIFVSLAPGVTSADALMAAVADAARNLAAVTAKYTYEGYEVQTTRLSFNSFEEWLPVGDEDETKMWALLEVLKGALEQHALGFCSLGPALTVRGCQLVPRMLAFSPAFNSSLLVMPDTADEQFSVMHRVDLCTAAARVCLELSAFAPGDGLTNFRFCAAFNCKPGIPYFPASYAPSSSGGAGPQQSLAVGLENGDLLFLAFHGVGDDLARARMNLTTTLRQALTPVQRIAREACAAAGIKFGGIDASIAPGLEPRDSVGGPMEDLYPYKFAAPGSVSAVSAITAAIKSLADNGSGADGDAIQLTGYSGLMLPVMEDIVMAARAKEERPDGEGVMQVRTLLQLSAVCGVGVDTVPVAGDVSAEALTALYMDVGALALRLRKPLSCRVLPLPGLKDGDITKTDSPYLTNTRVFSLLSPSEALLVVE